MKTRWSDTPTHRACDFRPRAPLAGAVTWRADGALPSAERHLGGVFFDEKAPAPDPHLVSARCVDGLLQVSEPTNSRYQRGLGRLDDYHMVDYPLFYLDLRKNAADRIAAHGSKVPGQPRD